MPDLATYLKGSVTGIWTMHACHQETLKAALNTKAGCWWIPWCIYTALNRSILYRIVTYYLWIYIAYIYVTQQGQGMAVEQQFEMGLKKERSMMCVSNQFGFWFPYQQLIKCI